MTGTHDARERLVAAAEDLLTRAGPRAVSMDAAAAAAGAGKMSAYRHCDGRDALIAAALQRHRPRHLRWLTGGGPAVAGSNAGNAQAGNVPGAAGMVAGSVLAGTPDPAAGLLAAFGRLEPAAAGESFRGCPFVDAALAAPPGGGAVTRAIAWGHKQDVMRELAAMARAAGLADPEELGASVALLIDGCAAQAALAPDRATRQRIIRSGRSAAQVLLAAAGRP